MKSSSTNDMLFVNGKFMGSIQHGEDFTVYVSPMMTYSKERFTKHYYADGERVSSRIGSGQFSNKFDQAINPVITAGNQNYVRRMALLNNESSKELVKKYNLPPGPATNKGIYEKLLLEGRLDAVENPSYVVPAETTYDIPRGWPKYPVFPDSGDVPGPPIQFEELVPDSVKAGYTFTDPNMIGEVDEYFYHGDHISSVVLVTDKKAKVVQQFAYMPFGELLVDNSTVDLDFRFSAKETDRESGLGYFGARYYDNTSAIWLGVDPLWEKYAGMNPYNYCAGNPVIYIDPNGEDKEFYSESGDVIGRMQSDDDIKYVLRTIQNTDQMYKESGSATKGKSNPISLNEAIRATVITGTVCSGSDLLSEDDIPMELFVPIPAQQEVDNIFEFVLDDGKGGNKNENNIEYGCNINYYDHSIYGNVKSDVPGDPSKDSNISVKPRIHHTHPSGTKGSYSWQQPPSKQDIENSEFLRYVWGMRSRTLYVFDKTGVKATVPFSVYGK